MSESVRLGDIVELKDCFRIYGHEGIYYVTRDKQRAQAIQHALRNNLDIKQYIEGK